MSDRPPIPSPPYHGGCLCGAVRYRLDARPLAVNACHCNDCKKLSGATHIRMLITRREQFTQESGETARYRKTAASGNQIDIVRCASCGVRLWHEPHANPELVFVTVGSLDDPSWAVPATHIWISRAAKDATFAEDAETWDAQPPSRQHLMDAFARLYPT